jgi:hypothetical protein
LLLLRLVVFHNLLSNSPRRFPIISPLYLVMETLGLGKPDCTSCILNLLFPSAYCSPSWLVLTMALICSWLARFTVLLLGLHLCCFVGSPTWSSKVAMGLPFPLPTSHF